MDPTTPQPPISVSEPKKNIGGIVYDIILLIPVILILYTTTFFDNLYLTLQRETFPQIIIFSSVLSIYFLRVFRNNKVAYYVYSLIIIIWIIYNSNNYGQGIFIALPSILTVVVSMIFFRTHNIKRRIVFQIIFFLLLLPSILFSGMT